MTAVYEEVKIRWGRDDDGKPVEYTVTPTYRMIQQIEQSVSIAGMSRRIANGDPPVSQMADVIAMLLRYAGADVSAEDVYAELMNSDDSGAIADLARIILTAFVPGKASSSPAAKKATGGQRKKRKT